MLFYFLVKKKEKRNEDMRRIFSMLFLALLGVTLVACGNTRDENVLIVGMEADYPPFNWAESSANDHNYPLHGQRNMFVAGYDVEMAKLIAAELGMELQIRMIEWDALIPALQSGQIDLIIAGMTPTADRRLEIDFTESYYEVENVIVAKSDSDLVGMTSLEALSGKVGVGQKDTVYADLIDFVAENFGSTVLGNTTLDTTPAVGNAVISGQADFTILERPVALGLIQANPELQIVFDPNPADNVFELSDDDLILSIGVKMDREEFLGQVNAALATISAATRVELMLDATNRS